MKAIIKPSAAHGAVAAPPSKSEAHRALICGALSGGSVVSNIALSDDIKATLGGLAALGADIEISGNRVNIGGIDINNMPVALIDAHESGSTLRFLIPLALLSDKQAAFSGTKRLFSRDISVYAKIANEQGLLFDKTDNSLTVCGKLCSGKFSLRGDISSQFFSGLMFALPLLNGDSTITVTTPLESAPYANMTVDILSRFGVSVNFAENRFYIPGGQKYGGCVFNVSGDYSNAAFLDAFNLFGGNVTVAGLSENTVQGDSVYKEYYSQIKNGGTFDLSNCPDLAPVMFALAAEFGGAHFTGTARLKLKESDRAAVMQEELEKFGGEIILGDNEVTVKKTVLHAPIEPLCSHNDHRVAMALSVLASRYGGVITEAQAVNKSYPGFYSDIKKLGIEVEFDD